MSVTTVLLPFARSELLLLSVLLYNESAQKYATFSAAQPSWQPLASACVCVCASVDVSLRCNKLALGVYLCACECERV